LLVDTDEKLQSDLGVTGLPATLFLDKDGAIVERHAGILDQAALNDTIGRLYGIT
jgi:thiol:disulfide interchange protein